MKKNLLLLLSLQSSIFIASEAAALRRGSCLGSVDLERELAALEAEFGDSSVDTTAFSDPRSPGISPKRARVQTARTATVNNLFGDSPVAASNSDRKASSSKSTEALSGDKASASKAPVMIVGTILNPRAYHGMTALNAIFGRPGADKKSLSDKKKWFFWM